MSAVRCVRCASGTAIEVGRTPISIGYACARDACKHVWLVPIDAPRAAGHADAEILNPLLVPQEHPQ